MIRKMVWKDGVGFWSNFSSVLFKLILHMFLNDYRLQRLR